MGSICTRADLRMLSVTLCSIGDQPSIGYMYLPDTLRSREIAKPPVIFPLTGLGGSIIHSWFQRAFRLELHDGVFVPEERI